MDEIRVKEANGEAQANETSNIETAGKQKRILLTQESLDVATFAAKNQYEHVLNTLHITDDYVEATDSYLVVRLHHTDYNPDCFPETPGESFTDKTDFLVRSEDVKKITIPKGTQYPTLAHACLTRENETVLSHTTDLASMQTVRLKPVQKEYPNTDGFFEPREGEVSFTVDARLLKPLLDYVIRFTKRSHKCPITFYVLGDLEPIRFSFELPNGQSGGGAVMPMRNP